ncbi:MAG: formate dehydrogenase accessory sulfurtransferase FdhD [Thermoproteota archaeon]
MSILLDAERIDISTGTRQRIEEPVAMEAPVNVYINGNYVITLLSTPRLQRELAVGWLFDEGVLRSWEEIEGIILRRNNVRVTTKNPLPEERLSVVGMTRILTTACGLSINKFLKVIKQKCKDPIKSDYTVEARGILRMVKNLDEIAELFKATGGTHAAALFEEGELKASAEDIGRHNAMDKTIGIAVEEGVNFSRCTLISSGRQPADMVLKAVNMGIPILATKASPIRSGIIAAKKTGITLICFVRQHRMNVYTHNDRILT